MSDPSVDPSVRPSAISSEISPVQKEILVAGGDGGDAMQPEMSSDDELFAEGSAVHGRVHEGLDGVQRCPHEDLEGAQRRLLADPGNLTACQREEHEAEGHIPYRSWCEHCVQARATGEQHRRRRGTRDICVFTFDYLFIGEGGGLITRAAVTAGAVVSLTILVAKDTRGKAIFGHVVPQKG